MKFPLTLYLVLDVVHMLCKKVKFKNKTTNTILKGQPAFPILWPFSMFAFINVNIRLTPVVHRMLEAVDANGLIRHKHVIYNTWKIVVILIVAHPPMGPCMFNLLIFYQLL